MPPPLPTLFYNACFFPFLTDAGRELSQKLMHSGFKPSHNFDNAAIDILSGLQRIFPRPILTIHKLEMGKEPFQAFFIQDDEGNLVSAIRHSSSVIDIMSDTINDLSLEGAILGSIPNLKYFLGCHYCFDKSDQRHLFRFTYVDRQSRFKSAQVFDYIKDPLICATNMVLMCGQLESPSYQFPPLGMPDPSEIDGPPRKRPCSGPRYKFKDMFTKAWLPIDKELRQISISRNGDTVWYADGRTSAYVKLSWEVVKGVKETGEKAWRKPTDSSITGAHVVWDGANVIREHAEVVECQETSIRSLLGIPPEKIRYLRTTRSSSLVETPLADLTLYHQLSLLYLVLTTEEVWTDQTFVFQGLSPFRLYARSDPRNRLEPLKSFAWDSFPESGIPLDVLPFISQVALKSRNKKLYQGDSLDSIIQLLLYVLYKPTLSSNPTNANLIWWDKDRLQDICAARAEFEDVRTKLDLPASLVDFRQLVHAFVEGEMDRLAMAREIDRLRAAVSAGRILSPIPVKALECPTSLGKRLFEHHENLPVDAEDDVPIMSSQSDRSGRLVQHQEYPFQKSSDKSTLAVSGDREDIPHREAAKLLYDELNGHCAPPIMPLPPILIPSDWCNGTYQKFYDGISEICLSEDVQKTLHDLSVSFSPKGREEVPQGYELAMAEAINSILAKASTVFGKTISVRACSSRELTMSETPLDGGAKATKRDPDIAFMEPSQIRNGVVKTVGDWSFVFSIGELKPINQPHQLKEAFLQILTSVRQIVLDNPDRISEQGFTCCGGIFTFYHFDFEGIARSEPYCISDHPLLFVNHVLLLSTIFTKHVISGRHHPHNKLICQRQIGIRGRRLAIYETECGRVEKNYWPTVRGELAQEVFVYQHLEKMIVEGKVLETNVTRMVAHEVLTTTTAIRRVFGIQSTAPREQVSIILNRSGSSIEHIIHNWKKLTRLDTQLQHTWLRKLISGIVAAIKGAQDLLFCGIAHGDISAGNICIAEDGNHFLTDLGLAIVVGDKHWLPSSGTPLFLSIRLSEATETSVFAFSPADDAESFIWVILWIAESIASATEGGASQFPSVPGEIHAYKSSVLAGNQNPRGPLARNLAKVLKNLKGLVNKPQAKLTLAIVLTEVLQLQTEVESRNPFI